MNQSPPNGSKGMEMFRAAGQPAGLARYVSAPGSLLTSIADSVVAGGGGGGCGEEFQMGRFFSGESPCPTSESTCKAGAASPDLDPYRNKGGGGGGGIGGRVGSGMQRSYGVGRISVGDLTPAPSAEGNSRGGGNPLIRHSSSPAGFLSHLMVDSVARDTGSYSRPGPGTGTDGVYAMPSKRFKSQLSFSRPGTLSQISEISVPDAGDSVGGTNNSNETVGNVGQSYISSNFSIGTWDDTNSIIFSAPPSKGAKDSNGDIMTSLSSIESQFSLPTTSLEMEKFLHIQQDQVPFKIRAKRGCATHPRSIAERERRTRISEKLRKLQELVPNMDKQTNTADMLDLAIQHIKSLQSQVQILTQERDSCVCASKQEKN